MPELPEISQKPGTQTLAGPASAPVSATPVAPPDPPNLADGAPLPGAGPTQSFAPEADDNPKIPQDVSTEPPPPDQHFGPAEGQEAEDFTAQYADHRDKLEADAAREDLRKAYGLDESEKKPAEKTDLQKEIDGAATPSVMAKATYDALMGFGGEMYTSAAHGIRQGLQNAINMPDDVGAKMLSVVAKSMESDPDHGPQFKALGDFIKERNTALKAGDNSSRPFPQLPEMTAPKTTTGALISGTAQFLTGMYLVGTVGKAAAGAGAVAEGVQAANKGLTIAKTLQGMMKGYTASYTAFSGFESHLADLFKGSPTFGAIGNSFLASDPNDLAADGRGKTGLEGELPGAMVQPMMAALKAMRLGRVLQTVDSLTKKLGETPALPRSITPGQLINIGDSEHAGLFLDKHPTLGLKPEDVVNGKQPPFEKFINYARIDGPEDVKRVLQTAADAAEKEGPQSWGAVNEAADKLSGFQELVSRRPGQPMSAAQTVAARRVWHASGAKLLETAKVAQGAPTEANLFAFEKMMSVHAAIQHEVLGARTETARALGAWKIPVGASGEELAKDIQRALENGRGAKGTRDMADLIAKMGDTPGLMGPAVDKAARGSLIARGGDALSQFRINMMLSSPKTHVANAMSNLAVAAQQVYERKGAELISSHLGEDGGVEAGEAFAMAHGALMTFKDAMQAFGQRVRDPKKYGSLTDGIKDFVHTAEPNKFGTTSVESQTRPSGWSSERWGVASETTLGRAMDMADQTLSTPGRLMSQSDNAFKQLGYRMELHAQACRQATREMRGGEITPDAFKSRMAEIIENPPQEVHEASVSAAKYATFQSKPEELLKKLGDTVQKFPGGRLLLPFKNTPINILTFSAERTPLAPLVSSWRADYFAGGARRDVALSRIATGTMQLHFMIDQAMSGHITGKGPENTNARANWLRDHAPYSMYLGQDAQGNKRWAALNRLDPVGMHAGMAADIASAMVNAGDEIEDHSFTHVLIGAGFSLANNTLNKTFMRSMADFVNALPNPGTKGEQFVNRLAGSFIPSFLSNAVQQGIPGLISGDPYARTAHGMIEELMRRIPGLSSHLPLYRDYFGRTLDYRSSVGGAYDMLSPVYIRSTHQEPIDAEIARVGKFPSLPDRQFFIRNPDESDGHVRIELTPHQYDRYVELAGKELKDVDNGNLGAKDYLNAVVSGKVPGDSQEYKEMSDGPDGGKASFIQNTLSRYKTLAREKMMEEDPALQAALTQKKDAAKGALKLHQGG